MSENTVLTSARVNVIFNDCLFEEGEDKDLQVIAQGITNTVGFHRGRLSVHSNEIGKMLEELPLEFQEPIGQGGTFLNACFDKHGIQWTGLHIDMEKLFQLGIAIGRVASVFPREMWSILPGSVPVYVVTKNSI